MLKVIFKTNQWLIIANRSSTSKRNKQNAKTLFEIQEENDFVKQLRNLNIVSLSKEFVPRSSSAIIETVPKTRYYEIFIKRSRNEDRQDSMNSSKATPHDQKYSPKSRASTFSNQKLGRVQIRPK